MPQNSNLEFRCLAIALIAVWMLGGCATSTGHSGELTIDRECNERRCTYMATMTNTGYRLLLSPHVELLGLDCDGNTIGSYSLYFDEILGGKKQTKEVYEDEPMRFIVKAVYWGAYRPVTKGQTITSVSGLSIR